MNQPDQPARIVIVDDEEIILTALDTLLEFETDYHVKTFTSPVTALTHIRDHDLDLVISDYLMPEMNGIAFLGEVRALKPDVPRIVVTGYADKENAIKGINEVGLFQYVEKPWDNAALLLVLRNAVERRLLVKQLHERLVELDGSRDNLQRLHNQILKTFI
jgi:DNA-binding NtrC family response regulator